MLLKPPKIFCCLLISLLLSACSDMINVNWEQEPTQSVTRIKINGKQVTDQLSKDDTWAGLDTAHHFFGSEYVLEVDLESKINGSTSFRTCTIEIHSSRCYADAVLKDGKLHCGACDFLN